MLLISLETAQVDVWLFWPILLGFLIGIITGLFGIGGGFILTPALRIFFGISYPIAIGSSLLQIMLTSVLSAYKHWKQDNIDSQMGIVTAIGSLVGSECGVRLLRTIDTKRLVSIGEHSVLLIDIVINSCFVILLTAVAVFMYKEACTSSNSGLQEPKTKLGEMVKSCPFPPLVCFEQSNISRLSIWMPIVLSLFVGCLTGFLGIGGGFVSLPLMIYLLGMPTRVAVGTSTIQVLLASGYGTLRHMQEGHVDVILVLLMVLGSLVGVNIGVKLSGLIDACNTRKYFAGLMIIAILIIIFDMLRTLFS